MTRAQWTTTWMWVPTYVHFSRGGTRAPSGTARGWGHYLQRHSRLSSWKSIRALTLLVLVHRWQQVAEARMSIRNTCLTETVFILYRVLILEPLYLHSSSVTTIYPMILVKGLASLSINILIYRVGLIIRLTAWIVCRIKWVPYTWSVFSEF